MIGKFSFYLLIFGFIRAKSTNIFEIQESLTIFCRQFPLILTKNSSNFRCARFRTNTGLSNDDFDLNYPKRLVLLAIVDLPSSSSTTVDLTVQFNQSSTFPSSIDELDLGLLVPHSNFTINNKTDQIYRSSDVMIFRWRNENPNDLLRIDTVSLENQNYQNDLGICKWNVHLWNNLFQRNSLIDPPYIYIMRIDDAQLTFSLIGTSNLSILSDPPTPYLNLLYCIPYRFGVAEIVLIVLFSIFLVLVFAIVMIVHHNRSNEGRTRLFQSHLRNTDQSSKESKNGLRQRASVSVSSISSSIRSSR